MRAPNDAAPKAVYAAVRVAVLIFPKNANIDPPAKVNSSGINVRVTGLLESPQSEPTKSPNRANDIKPATNISSLF